IVTAALAAAVVGCSGSVQTPTQPDVITVPARFTTANQDGSPKNHHTHLKGDEEVFTAAPGAPTPADSHAQGQAMFKVSPDGQSVDYKLIASNIHNVTQAHIHCAPAGANGPILIWLYPDPTATSARPGGAGRQNGVLAEGTFDNSHVRQACPGGAPTLADLLDRIRDGNAYVNVHTDDGVAPTNQGPGDFPGGEVRGQIR
ncbi:MAG TPA: CHRD domain-containing protein, partial [Vicinamibacterales bacterium]